MRYNYPMEDSLTNILRHKKAVDAHLVGYLTAKRASLVQINLMGGDVIDRLIPFVTSGKTTRGSLSVYIYSLFQTTPSQQIYNAAAALELFHSGFLIHDDIMDKDSLRRGKPSIWEQYHQLSHNPHVGISQAINTADLCFFMGQELLVDLPILGLVARELQPVIIAQMQDVINSKTQALSRDEVLSLYRYKTARYTFSLSMAVGATLGGASQEHIDHLMRLGESMGLLFQIRDDELSVAGDTAVTGKPVGSDEKNNKQTLATLINSEELNDLKVSLLEHCDDEIVTLPIQQLHKDELTSLVRFCLNRTK